jgi:hypothetical protein
MMLLCVSAGMLELVQETLRMLRDVLTYVHLCACEPHATSQRMGELQRISTPNTS